MSPSAKGNSDPVQSIARWDSLYRVASSDEPGGGFIKDGATGKLLVTVEQFAPAVGGGYSCNLVSVYLRHKNDPWSALSAIMPGPDSDHPRDSIIRFEAKVLNDTPGLEAFIKVKAVKYDSYSNEDHPSVNQTRSCSHVNVMTSDNKKLSEEDKHRFVESINNMGWILVPKGGY